MSGLLSSSRILKISTESKQIKGIYIFYIHIAIRICINLAYKGAAKPLCIGKSDRHRKIGPLHKRNNYMY